MRRLKGCCPNSTTGSLATRITAPLPRGAPACSADRRLSRWSHFRLPAYHSKVRPREGGHMANIIRPAVRWKSFSAPPEVLLKHTEPGWEFRELDYAPGGTWDHVTIWLHIASHLDPVRQRIGLARAPFLLATPSAAISAPGDHLAGAWDGRGRAQHIQISPGFIAAAMGPDLGPGALASRHFA